MGASRASTVVVCRDVVVGQWRCGGGYGDTQYKSMCWNFKCVRRFGVFGSAPPFSFQPFQPLYQKQSSADLRR